MNHYLLYLGAAYDSGAYGACTYQGECVTSTTPGTVGAPNTGFLTEPQIMVPLILGLAVLIAAIILVAKKLLRKSRG
jgi:hypothetical protein